MTPACTSGWANFKLPTSRSTGLTVFMNDIQMWPRTNSSLSGREPGSFRVKAGPPRVTRENRDFKVTVKRVTTSINDNDPGKHDLPGAAFRLVSKEVAYLKLSSVKQAECTHHIAEAAGTKGLIINIRNYPSEFVVFRLDAHLVEQATEFVRFTEGALANPGTFHWRTVVTEPTETAVPWENCDPGRPTLNDSGAEYTSIAFRSADGAIVIGSTTSGADGNVSPLALPGGLHTMIGGIAVFYTDKTATRRIGIKPSIAVRPTVAGIRARRWRNHSGF